MQLEAAAVYELAAMLKKQNIMIRFILKLTFLLLMTSVTASGQNTQSSAGKFFDFLNSYQKDSLQNILTDDFQLKRTYTTYSNDKNSFLEKYVPNSKAFNGKYKILKIITDIEPQQFLVEDQSDYLKYLDVDYPTWKITIATEQKKINQVTIDTTDVYQNYLADIKIADEKFTTWLKVKYPEDTQEELYNQEGLLTKRLKEYAEKKK